MKKQVLGLLKQLVITSSQVKLFDWIKPFLGVIDANFRPRTNL